MVALIDTESVSIATAMQCVKILNENIKIFSRKPAGKFVNPKGVCKYLDLATITR